MPTVLYPPSRPQDIGEVLDSAFVIFKVTLLKCLPYGLLAMVASQVQSIYDVATGRPLGSGGLAWWLFFGFGTLASIALWSAVILRQKAVLDERATSAVSDLAAGIRALPSMVAALVLALAAAAVGCMLLVLPGIYVLLASSFAGQVILLEGKGPVAALARSRRLVWGNALRVFTIFAVGLSMVLVFDLLMFTLVAVLLQFAGTGDLTLVTSYLPVVVIALGAVTAPFLCALGLALYGDLHARYAAKTVAEPARAGAEAVGATPSDAAAVGAATAKSPKVSPAVPAPRERAG
jgi:hypothetical protein